MARITYGSIVTDIKGSIGGSTFQGNVSGKIARSRPYTPVNPSIFQNARQTALSSLVSQWAALSSTNKNLWNALASANPHIDGFGASKVISGYQWFLSYNLNLVNYGESVQLFPQSYVSVDPTAAYSLFADADNFYIDFVTERSFPGTYALIYATPPLRQYNINTRKSTFLLQVWETVNVYSIELKSWYEAAFNVVWADLFNDSSFSVVVRWKNTSEDTGYVSPFTSAIIQI